MEHTPTGLLEVVRHALSRPEINVADVARSTGLSFKTVQSMAQGSANPTWRSLVRVANDLHSRRRATPHMTCRGCRFSTLHVPDDRQDPLFFSCSFGESTKHHADPCAIQYPSPHE